jgi:hypothetical protein
MAGGSAARSLARPAGSPVGPAPGRNGRQPDGVQGRKRQAAGDGVGGQPGAVPSLHLEPAGGVLVEQGEHLANVGKSPAQCSGMKERGPCASATSIEEEQPRDILPGWTARKRQVGASCSIPCFSMATASRPSKVGCASEALIGTRVGTRRACTAAGGSGVALCLERRCISQDRNQRAMRKASIGPGASASTRIERERGTA